jgi:hypothetical protein
MNIVKRHANDFLRHQSSIHNPREFIEEVETRLWDYNKDSHKVIFLDQLLNRFRIDLDKHTEKCTYKLKGSCPKEIKYEDVLFFLQNKLDEIEETLDPLELSREDRFNLSETLNKILIDINLLRLGQEITYEDLSQEFIELRENMHLSRKNWRELFVGKISDMVASGIVSETISKNVIKLVSENIGKIAS